MSRDDKRISEKIVKQKKDNIRIAIKAFDTFLEEHELTDVTKGPFPTWVTPSTIRDWIRTGWQASGPETIKANTEEKYRYCVREFERLWDERDDRNGYKITLDMKKMKTAGGEFTYPKIHTDGMLRKFREILKEKYPDRFPGKAPVGGPSDK